MTDSRLRELERRWKASGNREDEVAYLRELWRIDDIDQVMELLKAKEVKLNAESEERAAKYKADKRAEEERAIIAELQAIADSTVDQAEDARRKAQHGNEASPPSD